MYVLYSTRERLPVRECWTPSGVGRYPHAFHRTPVPPPFSLHALDAFSLSPFHPLFLLSMPASPPPSPLVWRRVAPAAVLSLIGRVPTVDVVVGVGIPLEVPSGPQLTQTHSRAVPAWTGTSGPRCPRSGLVTAPCRDVPRRTATCRGAYPCHIASRVVSACPCPQGFSDFTAQDGARRQVRVSSPGRKIITTKIIQTLARWSE